MTVKTYKVWIERTQYIDMTVETKTCAQAKKLAKERLLPGVIGEAVVEEQDVTIDVGPYVGQKFKGPMVA